jgi:hypothetical protein
MGPMVVERLLNINMSRPAGVPFHAAVTIKLQRISVGDFVFPPDFPTKLASAFAIVRTVRYKRSKTWMKRMRNVRIRSVEDRL